MPQILDVRLTFEHYVIYDRLMVRYKTCILLDKYVVFLCVKIYV